MPPHSCPDKVYLGGIIRTHGHCLHTVTKMAPKDDFCKRDRAWWERQECCRCDLRTKWKRPLWDRLC